MPAINRKTLLLLGTFALIYFIWTILRTDMYLNIGYSDREYLNITLFYETTTNSAPKDGLPTSVAEWQWVPKRRLLLKSAFVDLGTSNELKILTDRHCHERNPVVCSFYSRYVDKRFPVPAKYDIINAPDGRDCEDNMYKAYYVTCELPAIPSLAITRPTEVMISAGDDDQSSNPIMNIIYTPKHRLQLSFCIPPLTLSDPYRLLLFLEYYIYQGVDYFLVYRRDTSEAVTVLLNEYVKRGLVDIIEWPNLPMTTDHTSDPNKMVHYHSQILAMNDCLWRLRGRSKYVGLVDLDEFIVPSAWNDTSILKILQDSDRPSVGGFMFLSSYVYIKLPSFGDSLSAIGLREGFNFSEWLTVRESTVYNAGDRSKMIVKPTFVEKQTVHQVWQYKRGYKNLVIHQSKALIYHLRDIGGLAKGPGEFINDTILTDLLQSIFMLQSV